MRSSGRLSAPNQKQERAEAIRPRLRWSWPGGRWGPFGTRACRRRGGRGSRRLPSAASPERGTGDDGEEDRSQAATGEGLSVAQLSRPRDVLDDSRILIEVCSPLSAMHADLGRMVVDGGREVNGYAYSPVHRGVK
jgi:hypothetical protein